MPAASLDKMRPMQAVSAARHRFSELDLPSRAALLSFGTNAVLTVLKVSAGLAFGSVALLGGGVDSAEDVFASGVAFFSIRLALQPADETHPYGHGKAESIAAMSQAALIAGGGAFIAIAAVRRLIAHDVEIVVGPSLIAIGATIGANLGIALYARHLARVSGSVALLPTHRQRSAEARLTPRARHPRDHPGRRRHRARRSGRARHHGSGARRRTDPRRGRRTAPTRTLICPGPRHIGLST